MNYLKNLSTLLKPVQPIPYKQYFDGCLERMTVIEYSFTSVEQNDLRVHINHSIKDIFSFIECEKTVSNTKTDRTCLNPSVLECENYQRKPFCNRKSQTLYRMRFSVSPISCGLTDKRIPPPNTLTAI